MHLESLDSSRLPFLQREFLEQHFRLSTKNGPNLAVDGKVSIVDISRYSTRAKFLGLRAARRLVPSLMETFKTRLKYVYLVITRE
jgi:hypothetical protein